jgi:glucan biosynthesis protein C
MPYFIVHQPVILAIAFFVVQWDAAIWTKYAVLLPSAFVVSAALALLVSSLPGVPVLFGVKRVESGAASIVNRSKASD